MEEPSRNRFWGQPCLFCGEPIRDEERAANPVPVADVNVEIGIVGVQQLAHLSCLDAAAHPMADYRSTPRDREEQLRTAHELQLQAREARRDADH